MLDLLFGAPRMAAGGFLGLWGGGEYRSSGRIRTQAGTYVDEEIALTCAVYASAVRLIAETCAGLPIRIVEVDDDGNSNPLHDDPLLHILGLQPNPTMMALPWREGGHHHCVSWGQSFGETERSRGTKTNPDGEVVAVWPIHPWRVRPIVMGDADQKGRSLKDDGFEYYVRNNDGSTVFMRADEMLHVPGILSEDGIWGKSIVAHGRQAIGSALAVERYGASWFGSGGRPRFAVFASGMRDKQSRQNFREEWRTIHGSPDSGEICILQTDAKLLPINVPPEDSQFLGTGEMTGRQICRLMRVPPHLVGYDAPAGDIEQQGIEFVIYGLMRWLTANEQQWSLKLIPEAQRGRKKVEHVLQGLMRGNMAARMNAYRTAIMIGVMTINECRRLEGLNLIGEAGDKHYVPLNMQTAEDMAAGGRGQSGQPGPSRGGIGSDQGGGPFNWDEGADENSSGNGGPKNPEAAFASWVRQLGKARGGELQALLANLENRVRQLERPDAPAPVLLAGPQVQAPGPAPVRWESPPATPAREAPPELLPVPDVRQPNHYSCGAAAAMCVGRYFGVGPESYEEWEAALGTTVEQSTHPMRIVKYLTELGLSVVAAHNMTLDDLAAYWRRGMPVICPVQDYLANLPPAAEFDYGHYLTVIGCGLGHVFCQDSSEDNTILPQYGSSADPGRVMIAFDKWLKTWHDQDIDGVKYTRFGIAVARRASQEGQGRDAEPPSRPPPSLTDRAHGRGTQALAGPLAIHACGGPGSGVPGPCPESEADDQADEMSDRHEKELDEHDAAHEAASKELDRRQEKEQRDQQRRHDREDSALYKAHDKEDRAVGKARDKEDANSTDDTDRDAAREKEDTDRDARQKQERDDMEERHVKENKELDERHDKEWDQHTAEWDAKKEAIHDRHDRERGVISDGGDPPAKSKSAAPAVRPLLVATLARLLAVERNAAARAAKGTGFPAWLEAWPMKQVLRLTEALHPVADVALAAGRPFDPALVAAQVVAGSAADLGAAYDTHKADEWAALLSAWPERAERTADAILGQSEEQTDERKAA